MFALTSPTLAPPPTTAREIVTDTYPGGIKVEDPYRWLEGGIIEKDPAKAKAMDARVAEWEDAQNAYTRQYLDSIPGREALTRRITELMSIEAIGAPRSAGKRYFNRERHGSENQSILYVREGLNGPKRVLLDPNSLDDKGLISLDWYAPNQDGSLMAFGLSKAGDEKSTLYVMNVDTGEWLAEEIPNRAGSVSWLPDSSGFLYSVLRDVNNPYSAQIKFHELGTHYRQDKILFEQHSETWGPGAWLSRDGRWMMLVYWTGTNSNDIWVIDFDQWRRTGEFVKQTIAEGQKATFSGLVNGDTLYMLTTLDAPNGAVYAVDLNNPSSNPKDWKLILPERKDAVITDVSDGRGVLVVTYGYKAHSEIDRFDFDGRPLGAIRLPGIGSASVVTNDDRTEVFVTYTSFNEPSSIYVTDLKQDEPLKLWARPEVPVDPSIVEVSQVTCNSKDGTPITMFIVHKKGLKLDGNNPTLLTGYGGFNISMTPYFSATRFPWYEAGGVLAIPNLRGGGEYGEDWHKAGMLADKQNVFDDFIAAAQYLIDNQYTNPDKLAIQGGSNGGLLVGAVTVQRPDLFRAVVCAVPLLDMLRYQDFLMARYWVPEYGSSENPDQLKYLLKYSPYQNAKKGVKYPAILFTAGENDARVAALHARKMAAELQYDTTGDPGSRPILYWVDKEAGHGGGKPLDDRIREVVDMDAFICHNLGMDLRSAVNDRK